MLIPVVCENKNHKLGKHVFLINISMMARFIIRVVLVALARVTVEGSAIYGGYTGKITKETSIPALNSKSPVIVKQATIGTPSNLAKNTFVGNKIEHYNLQNGPVYREKFYMHKTVVRIPEDRAIRIKFAKEAILDSSGKICVNSSNSCLLRHDLNQNVEFILSSVRYGKYNGGKTKVLPGKNQTVYIEKHSLGESVEVSTNVEYDDLIVLRCSRIVIVMNGTVVRMYASNPDFIEGINDISLIIYFTALGVFGLLSIFLGMYVFCVKYEVTVE